MNALARFLSITVAVLLLVVVGKSGWVSNQKPLHALSGATWVVEQIEGRAVTADPPELVLDTIKGVVSGFTGVNRLHGQFYLKGNTITFGVIATTRRAGTEQAMNTELRFLNMLEQVSIWRLHNDHLEFLRDAVVLLRFGRKL